MIKCNVNKNKNYHNGFALFLGIEIVASMLLPTYLGYIIDSDMNTKPLFIIIFVLFGFVLTLRTIFRFKKI